MSLGGGQVVGVAGGQIYGMGRVVSHIVLVQKEKTLCLFSEDKFCQQLWCLQAENLFI